MLREEREKAGEHRSTSLFIQRCINRRAMNAALALCSLRFLVRAILDCFDTRDRRIVPA
jgi:hypothetical protein